MIRDIYLVLDDFGERGRSWREIDEERTERETVIRDLLEGQYSDPIRVVAFNTGGALVARGNHGHRRRAAPTLRGFRRATGGDTRLHECHSALTTQLVRRSTIQQ